MVGGRRLMLLYADQITAILLNLVQHSQQQLLQQQQVPTSLATVHAQALLHID